MKKIFGFILFVALIAVLYCFMSGYFAIKKGDNGSVTFTINKDNTGDVEDVISGIEDNFNISLPDEAKDKIEDAVDELAGMGFSKDIIIEEASKMYDKYGKDAVNHVTEAFENMTKQAIKDTAHNILDDIKQTIQDTVDEISK